MGYINMESVKTQISPVLNLVTEECKGCPLMNCTDKGLHWFIIHPDQNTVSAVFSWSTERLWNANLFHFCYQLVSHCDSQEVLKIVGLELGSL